MITVLLVDDHVSVRRSLRSMLEATEDIQVVATASNGVEALAEARTHCPDIAVVDIAMPLMDGMETARQLREICRHTRVMMLSILDNPEYVQRALDVGVLGYVLKDMVGKDLLEAIQSLARGRAYFSQKIAVIAQTYLRQKGDDTWAG